MSPAGADRWPAWFAPAGFLLATTLAALLAITFTAVTGLDPDDGGVKLVSTLLQDGALVLVAVGMAALVARPSMADFGLGAASLRTSARAFVIAAVAFYGLSALYAVILSPEGEQGIVEALGADDDLALLIGAGALLVVIAPYAEEVFFRGFFYRALRNRLGAAGATIVVALVFGAIHYAGSQTVELLPVLALFGAILCILYQRTGSLYPAVALHGLNNGLALATTSGRTAGVVIAAFFTLLTIASCMLAPALQRRRAQRVLPVAAT